MNPFDCLSMDSPDEDEPETQKQDLPIYSKELENGCSAVECLDEGGEPFEETKYESRKIRKKNSQDLKIAKQKIIKPWQFAETKRIKAWQLAKKQAQSKLIEFENKAKKGISVSLTKNYTDIIFKLLHIIHKDKPLSEIEIICKSFIEKLNDYWNEYIQNEMYEAEEEEEYNRMEQMQDMELSLRGIFWCEDMGYYYS